MLAMTRTKPLLGKHKLIWKIFIVLAFTGLALSGVVFGVSRLVFHGNNTLENTGHMAVRRLMNAVAADIGIPPQQQQLESVAKLWGVRILVEGPTDTLKSDPSLPEGSSLQPKKFRFGKPSGRFGDEVYFVHSLPPYRYIFFGKRPSVFWFEESLAVVSVIAVVSLIIAMAFLLLRRLLRPVNLLHEATIQMSQGNLDVDIPKYSNDELGALTDSFNETAARLKETIKSKERLLLDVSHELRSPLARMKLALEFIPEGLRREQLSDDIKQMESIVSEILENARLANADLQLRFQNVDLYNLAKSVAQVIVPSHAELLWSANASAQTNCDPDKISIVFKNLFENAVRHSGANSLVLKIDFQEDNETLVTTITDNGIGLSDDDLTKIFEPFYRADNARTPQNNGGYGLGLSLSRRIVEKHGGSLTAQRNNAGGIKFIMTLLKAH